jgi:DNA repair and recombination RAD54-like protein
MRLAYWEVTVVIVSYEKLRDLTEHLGQTEIGLLLADEGHRLKNSSERY